MEPDNIKLDSVQLRWDTVDGLVEVKSGGDWHQMSPDDARELADGYEAAMSHKESLDAGQARQFVSLLREYADKAEEVNRN